MTKKAYASAFILFVGFAAMSYGDDVDNATSIINLVDHPVITDTDTPTILCADEFTTAGWSGING